MSKTPPRNVQSGVPVAERTGGNAEVVRADVRDGAQYETDPDQIVKVVHQVKPAALPVQGPVDYGRRGGPQTEVSTDVAVTPETASVRDAYPVDEEAETGPDPD
jgi:hypothetical protein